MHMLLYITCMHVHTKCMFSIDEMRIDTDKHVLNLRLEHTGYACIYSYIYRAHIGVLALTIF